MRRPGGIWGGLLVTMLILVFVGGAAFMAYQAGFANGALAEGITIGEGVELGEGNYLPYRGYHPYGGFGFFGIGRLLFGLFAFFLFFGIVKRLLFFPFWMRYGGRRGMKGWRGGPWQEHWEGDEEDDDDESTPKKKEKKKGKKI